MSAGKPWSNEEDAILTRLWPTHTAKSIKGRIDRTEKAIKSRAKVLGLHKEKGRKHWQPAEDDLLTKLYPNTPTEYLEKRFNCTRYQIYARANRLGLKRDPEYVLAMNKALGRKLGDNPKAKANRFPKGHVPLNKGTRRPGYGPGRMKETQFKKGRPAHEARNYKPIGSTRIVYGNLERKVTDDPSIYPAKRWRPIHRLVWEEEHGPVPPGHICVFKKGMHTIDEQEITIDRIEVISLAENMKRNSYHTNYPKEIGLAIQARGALIRQINRRLKDEEQNRRPEKPSVRDNRSAEG